MMIRSFVKIRVASWALLFLLVLCMLAPSCKRKSPPGGAGQVVVYTSVDEPYARAILLEFEQRTGIGVLIRTDTEATKSAGLATRLEAEKSNPQADVWWGNEVFRSINLADQGILAPYASPSAANIPPHYKDPHDRWAGTALRARVIARTTEQGASPALPSLSTLEQLIDPAFNGRICMAHPAAGTTSGHMAVLYTLWGPEKFEQFLLKLKSNDIRLLGGNSVVAEYVGTGQMWAGLTDNDDVDSMVREGGKIEMVLPDQRDGEIGTLTIPCTVALVAGAKRPENAKKLVNYLLSREVEAKLLKAKFARYSVFADSGDAGIKPMAVTYTDVAKNLRPAVDMTIRVLEGRN